MIEFDSDPFIPGRPLHSTAELDELRKRYDSPSPSQQSGPRKQLADVIEDPPAPVAAPAPVAPVAPVAKADPVVEEKIVNGTIFKKVRKVKR